MMFCQTNEVEDGVEVEVELRQLKDAKSEGVSHAKTLCPQLHPREGTHLFPV